VSSYTVCPVCHGREVPCAACNGTRLAGLPETDQEQVARLQGRAERHLRYVIEDLADAAETAREYLPSADASERCSRFSAAEDLIRAAIGTLTGEQT
jgi:hypothetical protein